jgi:hypothetical protein
LIKCGLYPTDSILIAIIRRLDLDADARLNQKEFFDGIQPLENYTKGSMNQLRTTYNKKMVGSKSKKTIKRPINPVRPMTAKPLHSKTTLATSLHGG